MFLQLSGTRRRRSRKIGSCGRSALKKPLISLQHAWHMPAVVGTDKTQILIDVVVSKHETKFFSSTDLPGVDFKELVANSSQGDQPLT